MSDVIAQPLRKPFPAVLVGGLLAVAILVIIAGFAQGRTDIAGLREWLAPLMRQQAHAPLLFALAYFAAYVAATALCIPLEIPFALVAGALFGLVWGVVIASFASIFGATLAFLGARFLLRDHVRRCFGPQLDRINDGMARDGVFYLINMRLLPVVPFSLCNPLMGLTRMRVGVFFIVSQACMIFATVVFVNAGTQLPAIHSLTDIMSPGLVAGLAALAALPWLGKGLIRGVGALRRRAVAPR